MKSAWQAGGTCLDSKRPRHEGGHCKCGHKEEDLNAIAERAVVKALEKKAAKKKKDQFKKQDESDDEVCDAVEHLGLSSDDSSSDSK